MRSKNIQADILSFISDGKKHTLQEIANECEISKITAFRHIETLSLHHNIKTFVGGIDRGGVQLIPEQKVSVEKLTSDDLQLIIEQLELLQDSNVRIKSFITKLASQKQCKEN